MINSGTAAQVGNNEQSNNHDYEQLYVKLKITKQCTVGNNEHSNNHGYEELVVKLVITRHNHEPIDNNVNIVYHASYINKV